jgi:hypothetical protein
VWIANPTSLTNLYLIYLNKKHAQWRLDLGKSAQVVDESMLKKEKAGKAVELEDASATPRPERTEDKGFSDTTDLKNEDFIFVY